jgi:hypothetical protein
MSGMIFVPAAPGALEVDRRVERHRVGLEGHDECAAALRRRACRRARAAAARRAPARGQRERAHGQRDEDTAHRDGARPARTPEDGCHEGSFFVTPPALATGPLTLA